MSTSGNIEDVERHLRAPATSFRQLLLAGTPFVRAANIIDALSPRISDDQPLREYVPGAWPTVGDLRRLRDALVAAGWKPGEEY